MAKSLRQAYDYWQDQPGNYYPFAPIQSIATATNGHKSHLRRREFIKLAEDLITAPLQSQASLERETN